MKRREEGRGKREGWVEGTSRRARPYIQRQTKPSGLFPLPSSLFPRLMDRRQWLRASFTGAATVAIARRLPALSAAPIAITVYKSPTCGCCKEWVTHVEKNGFKATVHDLPEADLQSTKKTLGIPDALRSCHTAVSGRYAFEGHVPADLVKKVIAEKAAIIGLAVPGMPQGSPGMETGRKDAYDVVAFEKNGKTRVYARR
jgi:hypothetical protein